MDSVDKREMCYLHAMEHHKAGNYSAAIAECSTAISEGLVDARIYNARAFSYYSQGEYLKARLDFDASFKLDPTDSWVGDFRDKLINDGY